MSKPSWVSHSALSLQHHCAMQLHCAVSQEESFPPSLDETAVSYGFEVSLVY